MGSKVVVENQYLLQVSDIHYNSVFYGDFVGLVVVCC